MKSQSHIERLRSLPEASQLLSQFTTAELESLQKDWEFNARPNQLAPLLPWSIWVVKAGRGFGKTRTGAEWIRSEVEASRARQIALVAPTSSDARDVMVEGESGLMNVFPPNRSPIYEPSKRKLTFWNGATAHLYSSEKPERLRGPQHDCAWCDELCAWGYVEETWRQLRFGLRLGSPRTIITTTPKPIPLFIELLKRPGVHVTSGRTYDNESNLAQEFLTELRSQYEGTRIGRQEIDAEVLEDVEGALWDWGMIHRLYPSESPQYRRIVVGVDPSISASGSGDACGIVAAGITPTHQIHVLQDRTLNGSPLAWSRQAVKLAIELEADAMVYEVNQGGAMVSETLKLALKSLDHHIRLIPIHAARGKTLRAEPVVSLYEQGKVEHIGNLAALEEEMTGWVPDISTRSPNRVDALVYALTELAIKVRKPFIVSVA